MIILKLSTMTSNRKYVYVFLCVQNSLRYCLDSGFHDDVNKKDNAGYTPLHECCVFGRLWIAEQLILCGADVNVSSYDGTR